MASQPLPNYLRLHRKRLGLSQDEIACLLGVKCGAKISRLEHFNRRASLETALAYGVIFKRPVSELFSGLYRDIERMVRVRARLLAKRIEHGEARPDVKRKLAVLATIINIKNC